MFKNMRLLGDMEFEGVLSLLLYTAEFQHGRQGTAAPTTGTSTRPNPCGRQETAAPTAEGETFLHILPISTAIFARLSILHLYNSTRPN